jgi:hypothetical protein
MFRLTPLEIRPAASTAAAAKGRLISNGVENKTEIRYHIFVT